MPIVHGTPISPFVRKVCAFLGEKGVAYELRELVPFPKTPELLEISPLGKIPVFEDGAFVTPDSSVICAYAERRWREPALYPDDPEAMARALWLEEYADTHLSEILTTVFFQRFVRPNVFGESPDEERIARVHADDLPPVFDYLERQADPDGLVGGRISIADVAIASPFGNWRGMGQEIDAARWPRLAGYVDAMYARPAFKDAAAPLAAMLGGS